MTGPNGVGKSSLLRTLAGLVPPAEGHVRLEGGTEELTAFEHCHYFGHQDAVKPALSVIENLTFWQAFSQSVTPDGFTTGRMAPADALDGLGIGHTARLPAAYLSAGQKRRLSLARLLVTPRPIWLMDEPTSALDADSEKRLIALMNGHLLSGGLIVTATHTPLTLNKAQKLHLEPARDHPAEVPA